MSESSRHSPAEGATDGETANGDTTGEDTGYVPPETSVPADASPVVCEYCGFPLPDETQHELHLGLEHYGQLSEEQREAFVAAYQAEEASLNRFRIIALGGLVLLYFGFLIVYALLAV